MGDELPLMRKAGVGTSETFLLLIRCWTCWCYCKLFTLFESTEFDETVMLWSRFGGRMAGRHWVFSDVIIMAS